MNLSDQDLIKLYSDMVYIRTFERRLEEIYITGVIPGLMMFATGQEACMAGVCFMLEPGDILGSSHRETGALLCRGASPGALMAELFGKGTGLCKGKGGFFHTAAIAQGALGNNAVLGPGQTIINGYALANQMRGNGKVAVTMFGEGASNRGEFHEGLNFASIWKLPTVFVLSNNGYSVSMAQEDQQRINDLSARAANYGVPGVSVDGNDVIAVVEAMDVAIRRARSGGGPSLVELKTYRLKGHVATDPAHYRTQAELERWLARDPVKRMERNLLDCGILTQDELAKIQSEYDAIVEDAVQFARESPWPPAAELYAGMYALDEGAMQGKEG